MTAFTGRVCFLYTPTSAEPPSAQTQQQTKQHSAMSSEHSSTLTALR